MKSSVLLSIVVAAYNVEEYIVRCLSSIINQTIKDIEVLVINDGSTDKTQLLIERFIEETLDERVILINTENKGLSEARNKGVHVAKGEYIAFVDGDDCLPEYAYSVLLDSINNNADIACGHFINVNSRNKILTNKINAFNYDYLNSNDAIREFLLFNISPNVCDKLFRASLFKENDIKFPSGKFFEDLLVTFNLITKARKVSFVNIGTYYYLQRGNSITKKFSEKSICDFMDNIEGIKIFLASNSRENAYTEYYEYYFIKQVFVLKSIFNKYLIQNNNNIKNEIEGLRLKVNLYSDEVKLKNVIGSSLLSLKDKVKVIIMKFDKIFLIIQRAKLFVYR